MKNYSIQREAILEKVSASHSHPTASEIYEEVRKKIPNISLGTVYRNLSQLSENGDILLLSVGEGCERYDGNVKAHLHLHCKACGKIFDIPLNEENELYRLAKKEGFKCESTVCIMEGVCKDCDKF